MKHFEKLYVWAALGIIVVLPFLYMDYGSKEYPELNKAIRVVRYMSAERQLQRSAFRFTYPEGRPEQFVEWMFSPIGSAIWPPVAGGGEFSQEEEKMIQKTGIPFLPSGVSLVSNKPDMDRGQQVVVRGDDERQMMVVEGYLDPQETPVLAKEWRFPLGVSGKH
mgnify:CR=1 FL=1|jgi:hypothetical protein